MTENRDKELVANFLKSKREEDFRLIYRDHTLSLYRLALHLTNGNTNAAEDIIQEMWMRGIKALPEFRWNSTLKTWLASILINCYREHHRKSALSSTTIDEVESILNTQPQKKWDDQIDILRALSALPPGYREILVLHDMEGYKHDEIGALLGISTGTSKSQLFHARKAIKRLLI